jgi:membrane protein DedA with SNARE-associated domain
MTELFKDAIALYMDNINYFTVFIFMAIESTFIPFPSEIVIPPAAYKAANGELNIILVTLFGTMGALFGSLINYFLAIWLGRKVIYSLVNTRFAKLFMLSEKSVIHAENYFLKNGNTSTLIGRLVPGVRHLISIPAGIAKMKLANFILYTTIGAFAWNVILAALGYFFYSQKELLDKYFHELTIGLLVLGGLFVLYLVYKGVKRKKEKQ